MRHLHLDQLLYSLRLPYSLCSGQSQRCFLYVHMSFIEYKCTVLCVYFQLVMYFAIKKRFHSLQIQHWTICHQL